MENSILPKRESVESVNNYLKRYRREAIGGGCVGALIAYWLKKRAQNRLNVIVVKKDATYQGVSLGVSTCLAKTRARSIACSVDKTSLEIQTRAKFAAFVQICHPQDYN
ncbi:hypothetical protein quinque_013913 [Culex quinquefasciatus]